MVTPPSSPSTAKQSVVGLRYKFVWRLLIISNLALGAYMFATPKRKNVSNEEAIAKTKSRFRSTPVTSITTPVFNESRNHLTNVEPVKVHPSIPQNQPNELLK